MFQNTYILYQNLLIEQIYQMIVSVKRYHRSARIGTIIAEEPVPL